MSETLVLHGDVDDGYGPVADAFRANFTSFGEVGAAVAIYSAGKPVVDLWAGHRDRKRSLPWERDTMVPVFSSTKGMTAMVVASAVSRGLLEYERPVAEYWPEFAAHGKDSITVRQLLDHQTGIPAFNELVRLSEVADPNHAAKLLADQKPLWAPGTRQGYHPMTGGLCIRELIRRTDSQQRTVGQYFAEEFAGPLNLDFHIGLPEDPAAAIAVVDRLAELAPTQGMNIVRWERNFPLRLIFALTANRRSLSYRAMTSPDLEMPPEDVACRTFLDVENPAAGGVGTARALANVYGLAAINNSDYPQLPISQSVLDHLASPPVGDVPEFDLVLKARCRYNLGFRQECHGSFGPFPSRRAYGNVGLGGSFGAADRDYGIGIAYTPNRLGMALVDDVRARRLREALLKCV